MYIIFLLWFYFSHVISRKSQVLAMFCLNKIYQVNWKAQFGRCGSWTYLFHLYNRLIPILTFRDILSLSLSPFLFQPLSFKPPSVSLPLFLSPHFFLVPLAHFVFFISIIPFEVSFTPPYSYNFKNSHFLTMIPPMDIAMLDFSPLYQSSFKNLSVWACIFQSFLSILFWIHATRHQNCS